MILSAFLLAAASAATAPASEPPVVAAQAGAVRGVTAMGVDSFKGVPFAAPPVGPLRWRAPAPAPRWEGVRDATQYGHDCMQKPFPSDAAPLGTTPGEDCLVLNVWRPAGLRPGARLPVVVWIYGGGFVNGGSSPTVYDGAPTAAKGVVFVSFNYRLGRFGFFVHPAMLTAHEGPVGNWGLMDQQAALAWVQRNISAFGGDPRRVTVAGESAGGVSVMALVGAPAARDQFQQAVVMSGAGRVTGPLRQISRDLPGLPSAATLGRDFALSVGVRGDGPDALAALRALPAERIVGDLNLATLSDGAGGTFTGPVQDGLTLTASNEDVFARGGAHTPAMVGATSADVGPPPAKTKAEAFAQFGPTADRARAVFDPDGAGDPKAVLAAIGGDRTMVEPARFLARGFVRDGRPAFHYRFGYVAASMRDAWRTGAPHASDIPFFLDTVRARYGAALTEEDAAVARAANDELVAFAKTGAPEAAGEPRWPTYGPSHVTMMFEPSGARHVGPDAWDQRLDLSESLAAAGR